MEESEPFEKMEESNDKALKNDKSLNKKIISCFMVPYT